MLKEWRDRAGISQAVMAKEMGLSLRVYFDLEHGVKTLRKRHQLAFERVTMRYAVVQKRMDLAAPSVMADARAFLMLKQQLEDISLHA